MSTNKTAVYYVTAHPDDWQLFRGYTAWHDLQSADVYGVFITLTAGDGGSGEDYWQAREDGEVASVKACLPAHSTVTADPAVVRGHTISRRKFAGPDGDARAVLYSLRLPDGNHGGEGYPDHECQSMERLRSGQIQNLRAVDDSATYATWADLWGTLQAIMAAEQPAGSDSTSLWVNANQYWEADAACKPDHADHLTVGAALKEFVDDTYNRYWWKSYASMCDSPNLGGLPLEHKYYVYGGYLQAMSKAANVVSPNEWINWGDKVYGTRRLWNEPDGHEVPPAAQIQTFC